MDRERAVFRYIEAELYNYRATQERYDELRRSIMERALPGSVLRLSTISGGKISDPTGAATTRLEEERQLRRMQEALGAIGRVMSALPRDQRELVERRYWSSCRMGDGAIMRQLKVSRSTYYRWRREIILAIARELGLRAV